MCGREDSNLHPSRDQDLNLARLPVSPRPQRADCSRLGRSLRNAGGSGTGGLEALLAGHGSLLAWPLRFSRRRPRRSEVPTVPWTSTSAC